MTCGIYSISGPDGFTYIGQSLDVEQRFFAHYIRLQSNEHPCVALQEAWNDHRDFKFKFAMFGSVSPHGIFRYALEQYFMRKAIKLYNEAKRIIRTCAIYPDYFVASATQYFRAEPRIQFISPNAGWDHQHKTGSAWDDTATKNAKWVIGIVTDTQRWERAQVRMCPHFGITPYNPMEEFKRLGSNKLEGMPRTRKAFSPYIFCHLRRGLDDLFTLKENLVPINFLYAGAPIIAAYSDMENLFCQEEVGFFVSTEKERKQALLRAKLSGAKFDGVDGENLRMLKAGLTFEVPLTEFTELYATAT